MSTQIRKIFGFGLILALVALAGSNGVWAEDADIDIVTVDINEIMTQHPALEEAQQTLQREAQQMQGQLEGQGEQGEQEQQMAQQQLQQRSTELQMEALDKVKTEIRKIAAEKGYTYVMEKNALLAGGRDVTDEVIGIMTEMHEED
ncbi:MAG: OmpH family outer membrane protein [Desulfosudaceae bacterium]